MKKKFGLTIGSILFLLIIIMSLVAYIDPYFHFHGPMKGISYRLGNQRYLNDGLARNYDYDAVIIGTSMTENFRTSEVEALFGMKAIKTPYAGAGYKELSDSLKRYYTYNEDIKMVIWGMDMSLLVKPWDYSKYSEDEYPDYLYDNSWLNDINYLLNKEVVLKGLLPDLLFTVLGRESTTMDDYSWLEETVGKEAVLGDDVLKMPTMEESGIVGEFAGLPRESIEKNYLSVIKEHPETQFYIFIPPYSIAEWADYWSEGSISKYLETEKTAVEMLIGYDNVHVFCFYDEYEMIENLDNYRDKKHYIPEINTMILESMKSGEHEITQDNIHTYFDTLYHFYSTYDYAKLYE